MEIRALRASDDRSRFRSGEDDLDRFFHRFAGQNQFRHHIGVTYVAVAPAHIEGDDIPMRLRGKLPRYPLPVLRLARLAVDERAQAQGIGKRLLRFAMELATKMADDYGCVGIIVDAKPGAMDFYRQFGFVSVAAVEGLSDVRPQQTPMFLSLRAISAGTAVPR
jgi:predicted N-acetyltransferase YhbS